MHKEIFGKSGDWKGIKKFRAQSKFTTYLYGIVTFRALDFLKSKGMKYSAKSVSVDSQINISNTEIDPNDQMTIDSTLSILTDKEKKIIKLYSEGYKHREIAIKLRTSTNNISSIISRAQKKMQKYNAIKQTNSQS
jgi:RNA polymerase sigma factor (sigma-70 family)